MNVLLSRPAARQIFDEVQRWVERGLAEGGSALESLMYPLAAMVPRERHLLTPVELVGADHIQELVIDGAAIPPDEIKAFSAANCHFAGDIAGANVAFNARIDELLAASPRLSVSSKLHAHPFDGGCFLSSGDLFHGVTAPKARAWRQGRGLDTAILHVVYPDGVPGRDRGRWRIVDEGAIGRDANGKHLRWRVHSWASRDTGAADAQLHDLGDARVVPTSHDSVRAARRKTYWQRRRGARWCDGQKRALREAGYRVSRNLLGRGWRRYLVDTRAGQLLIALPPDFPALPPRVLLVRRAWCNDFEPLELPRAWRGDTLSRASLLALVDAYGAPTPRGAAPVDQGQGPHGTPR
ncbi:MAG: hypothetical protein CSA65_00775 [Proteobacteria bacterium]|nr:MAG: hypothetical protein CSB49_06285 [Pseudomonadota bacterium]PIE19827.1 MAG: hypothetical protein CSA65_00775 [Pseudomonadota bacterium]